VAVICTLTQKGNPRSATHQEVNGWASKSVKHLTKEHILNSWEHTLKGDRVKECADLAINTGGKKWEVKSLVSQREKDKRERESALKKHCIESRTSNNNFNFSQIKLNFLFLGTHAFVASYSRLYC